MNVQRMCRWFYGAVVPSAVVALLIGSAPTWSYGLVVVAAVAFGVWAVRQTRARADAPAVSVEVREEPPTTKRVRPARVSPDAETIPELLRLGRQAFVIQNRERWADNDDTDELLMQAVEQLDARLALVPEGSVALRRMLDGRPSEHDTEVRVAPFLLNTATVRNDDYQQFVDHGGYEDPDLWPEDILPLVLEFRDATGELGPRFWRHGQHASDEGDRPVVGVSWFEAAAYAKWVGQRLPTEAEWQMAANWRVAGSTKTYQRSFPWGETMDHTRCNVWLSMRGQPVGVADYPEGSAPNDVRQLIGNVWEWTESDFEIRHPCGQTVCMDTPAKCMRGGAFDTYFETQASSTFRTGQNPLNRKHNVGFRCALSAEDIPILVST